MKKHSLPLIILFIITTTICQAQTPVLWGMTSAGGQPDDGIILSYNVATGIETNVHNFTHGNDGTRPSGSFIQATNGLLYGFAGGGTHAEGAIISYDIATDKESLVYSFGIGTDGIGPTGKPLQVNDSLLYGMTVEGGTYNVGTIFCYNILTGVETDVYDFGSSGDGDYPSGSLIQVGDSLLYGMTGPDQPGVIFNFNIYTGIENVVYNFTDVSDGQTPWGSLLLANNGLLYGMTELGGTYSRGIIFSFNTTTNKETVLHNFGNGIDGSDPLGSLIQAKDSLLYGMTGNGGLYGFGAIISYNISTGIETDIHDFGAGYDGIFPNGSLMQSSDTLLYGMTYEGGYYSEGIMFSYDILTGIETDIHDFSGAPSDGSYPYGDLLEVDSVTIFVTPVTSTICKGSNVTLKATGATTYTWIPATGLNTTTGDSVIASPTVTTTYTVTGTTGVQTSTKTVTVTVTPPPFVTITTPSPICYGGSTKLTAGGAAAYTWSPSAGLSSTVGATVTADPTVTTTYTITGTVAGGCSGTNTVTVSVNPTPTITASPDPASYCSGESSTLTASGGNTYTWSPATALSATTGATVTANPTVTTTYTVTGTNSYDCSATNTVIVTVNPLPVITATPNPAAYCPGGNSTLTASGGVSYTWSPFANLSATTGAVVIANPSATTTYTVTGTNSNGCSTSNTVTVTVNPTPTITASPNPASYCLGESSTLTASGGSTYTWSPATSLSATTGSTVTANPTVTTTYTVTGTNTFGCSATNTVIVTVNPNPIITASPNPAAYCPGGSSTLTASGGDNYTWTPSAALSATSGSSVTANPTITTTYTVTGTNSYGCSATKTVTVTVNPLPTITTYASPYSYCPGLSSTLTVSGGATYTWSPSTDLSATTGNSVVTTVTATTTYTVSGTDDSGCVNTATVTVTVGINPIITASALPSSYCVNDSATLTASGGLTYTWTPATGLSATTGDSVIASPTVTTTYTVNGSSGTDCAATTTVIVTVNPNPTITVNPNPAFYCPGGNTVLIASGGSTYIWSPSTDLSATTGDTVTANPTLKTGYTVTGTDTLGCSATVTDTVSILPSPGKPSFYQHGDTLISSSITDNQWYRNDTLLVGDTSQHLIITSLGYYWVVVNNEANGCSTNSDTMKITQITGINQLSINNNQLSIYPNPTSGEFTIQVNGNETNSALEVYNIMGEEVYQSLLNSSQTSIDLSSQPQGIYFVYLKSEKNMEVGKVILSK